MKNIKLIFGFYLLFQNISSSAQNNFAIAYWYPKNTSDTIVPLWPSNRLIIIVQDSIAYSGASDEQMTSKIKMPELSASTFGGKSTLFNKKRNTKTVRRGNCDIAKKCRLVEKKNKYGEWKITGEKKSILGFECTKAIGKNEYGKYAVWFSERLPGGFGPHMMTNLPGFILEAINENGIRSIAYKISY